MGKKRIWVFFVVTLLAGILFSCAPGPEIYHVRLRYDPVGAGTSQEIKGEKLIAVTLFRDVRPVDDQVKMGWVLHPKGKKLWVMPEEKFPEVAVTEAVKEYLRNRGFRAEARSSHWDLKDETIATGWGDFIIGGAIEELEVTCDDSDRFNPVKKYQARVRIKFVLADGKQKRVIYRTEAEATTSLKDVSFSREKLEKQLNAALFEVLNKGLGGKEMSRLLNAL